MIRSQTSILYSLVHCLRSMPPVWPGVADVNAGIEANRCPMLFLPWMRSSPSLPGGVGQDRRAAQGPEPVQVLVDGLGLFLGVGEDGVVELLVEFAVDEHQEQGG